jgi:predicted metal-dependent peptidase
MSTPLTRRSDASASAASDALARVGLALRRITVPFPYLAGLAAAARVQLDARVPTMGVFASGRMVANAQFVGKLNDADLNFVVAHELLHLALRTHQRARGSDLMQFNVAHDYIINDVLRHELGIARIPAGGLDMQGARLRSAEAILLELRREAGAQTAGGGTKVRVWQPGSGSRSGSGGGQPDCDGSPEGEAPGNEVGEEMGDVLADALEREWFDADAQAQREQQRELEQTARRGMAVARARGRLPAALAAQMGLSPGHDSRWVDAARGAYRTPAQIPLQRWIESVTMGPRTFERPARRAAGSAGIVLPGRRRESQVLNVVLDTSGSMSDEMPRALGALGDVCEALGVAQVRLIQCDAIVTSDDTLEPQQLARKQIAGYGGSDLSPALRYLANDPEVRAVVVITDGDIQHPDEALPFELLWLLPPQSQPSFRPRQGRVMHLCPRT